MFGKKMIASAYLAKQMQAFLDERNAEGLLAYLQRLSNAARRSADALLGEITPGMAVAVGRSPATKLLLPVNQCSSIVAGTQQLTLAQLIDSAVAQIAALAARG